MRLVLIEWLDAFGCGSDWQLLEDFQPKPLRCRSVGWLLHDGDECKVIVPHLTEPPENTLRQGCGDMTIPSSVVLRVVDLLMSTEVETVKPQNGQESVEPLDAYECWMETAIEEANRG